MVLQLITGSIIIPNESKIDPAKWSNGMVNLFERRFGSGESGMKLFKVWADNTLEFMCWFTDDDELLDLGYTDDDLAAICAYDLIGELESLNSNKYIECYIDILQGYLK